MASSIPRSGANTMKASVPVLTARYDRVEAVREAVFVGDVRHGSARISSNQRMGRARGQCHPPRDQVPGDGTDQTGQDHMRRDMFEVYHPGTHSFRNTRAEAESSHEVKKAAQATACKGVSTRVETTVAMELAASWNPLMKSKARATRTMTATRRSVESIGRQLFLTITFCNESATSSAASVVCSRNS